MNSRLLEKIPLIRNRTKVLISASLLWLAFILFTLNQYDLDRKLCLLAMFFSFLGDLALNCKPLEKRSHSLLYTGAFFFMISHVMYAAAYYQLIQQSDYPYLNFGSILAVIIMVSILCISIYGIRKSQRLLKPSMILVFSTYLLMISTNFVTIYSYSWNFHAFSLYHFRFNL